MIPQQPIGGPDTGGAWQSEQFEQFIPVQQHAHREDPVADRGTGLSAIGASVFKQLVRLHTALIGQGRHQ